MNVVYLARDPVPERAWTIPRYSGARVDEDALSSLVAALQEQDEVVLSGVAGSGKTTLIRWLTPTYLIAPTAKAAHRLASACSFLNEVVPAEYLKRREAHTVHSTVYSQPEERWLPADSLEPCQGYLEDGVMKPAPCKGCSCRLELQWPGKDVALKPGTILVVDESSMLDHELVTQIRQRVAELGRKVPDLRVLWVGDPAQLPPVQGSPGVDLQNPDVMLEKVYRTDRAGILELSTRIRHAQDSAELSVILKQVREGAFPGVEPGAGSWAEAGKWRVDTGGDPDSRMLITWTNADRVRLNQLVRQALKRSTSIQRGDRLLIRKNNRNADLLNGEILTVTAAEIDGETARIAAIRDGAEKSFIIIPELLESSDHDAFARKVPHVSPPWPNIPIIHAQYGYALTCHAAQGSQAPHVGVMWTGANNWMAQKNFPDARAWLYTAVTRAEKSLTIWQVGR